MTTRLLLSLALLLMASPVAAQQVPQNSWIVWSSDRQDSRHEIYLMQADGTNIQRLTHKGGKFPSWSTDGVWISYQAADGSVHVMRWDKSADKQVFTKGKPRFWMLDGSGLFVSDESDKYYVVDPETGQKTYKLKLADFSKMSGKDFSPGGITHDGKYIMGWSDRYRSGFTGANGTFKAYNSAVILDLTDKSKVYFFGDGCEPTAPPSGSYVYHVCGTKGDCPSGPDVVRMDLGDIKTRSSYKTEVAHKDSDWGHEYFPRVSYDNKWLVYGATTGCHDHNTCDYEIFVHALGGGNAARKRVTNDKGNDQWPHLWVGALWKPGQTPDASPAPGHDTGPGPAAGDPALSEAGAPLVPDAGVSSYLGDGTPPQRRLDGLTGGCAMTPHPGRSSGSTVALVLVIILVWIGGRRRMRKEP